MTRDIMTTSGARVEVDKLEAGYGRTAVLSGIDLDVPAGSFVALIGASGCGKTTLLRTICGFIAPSAGRIRFDGMDVTELPPERRNTAMVFQSYALWPHMTVEQNLAYGLKLRGWPKAKAGKRVEEMLVLLDLRGFGSRKVTALSGGQRQRVALGRALAIDPPILLLDEPLSNLDAKIRNSMRHEIRALQERIGFTAIHVTHDQEEAMVMADRIVILDRGRIVQEGTPEDVYRHPNSPFVASFLGADNVIEATAARQGDRLSLRINGGEPTLVRSEVLVEGPCVVHFRADAVQFKATGGDAGWIAFDGRIEQASYAGGRHRYAVRTAAGQFLVDDTTSIPGGSAVRIFIPAEALHIFARPETPDQVKAA
jgi:putative spermidine/putrescine transport system ATP-binding protein